MPSTAMLPGTGMLELPGRPFSRPAATVKILKTEPAPSPTSEKGCGCTVCDALALSP
ncbi:Uncharacterised protein [Mycobacteroides abscessus subsp. abscessus]|nr:Uncharacterised protein [Mycobacteroides abscessus subsp. abscessus]